MDRRTFLQGMAAVVGGVFTADMQRRFSMLELPGEDPVELPAEVIEDPTPSGSWLYWNGQVYPADQMTVEMQTDTVPIVEDDGNVGHAFGPRRIKTELQVETDKPLAMGHETFVDLAGNEQGFGVFGIFSAYKVVPQRSGFMVREPDYMLLVGHGVINETHHMNIATSYITFTIDTRDERIANRETFLQMRQYESLEAARRAFQDVQSFEQGGQM